MPSATEAHRGARIARGLLAGAVAGAVAGFAMDRFQALAGSLMPDEGASEPATEQAADAMAEHATGREIAAGDKPLAGQAVHYALGIALGAAYGVAAEFRPAVTRDRGAGFGLGTAALLDEALVPAVGLGAAPWNSGAPTHLYAFASHLVFGVVTEAVRRQIAGTLTPSDDDDDGDA